MEEKYYCRNCTGERKHKILHEKIISNKEDKDEEEWFSFIDKYMIIECCGCSNISFVNVYGDETMIRDNFYNGQSEYYNNTTIYPPYLADYNELSNTHHVPTIILSIYNETIEAIKSNCYLLAGGGSRAVIEAICKNLNINKKTLEQKIDELNTLGHLTLKETQRLHAVRFLGNDSLHEMQKPTLIQLKVILEIINHLLNNLYIQDKIIEPSLDVLVCDFESFLILLNKRLSNETHNSTKSLLEILGKSKRLMKPENIRMFEEELLKLISKGEYPYLSDTGTKKEGQVIFNILSTPFFPEFF